MLKITLPAALVATGIATFAGIQDVDPARLPEGEAKALLTRTCGDCHGLDVVTRKRMTPPDWKDAVDDMISRGPQTDEGDVRTITMYLVQHVGRVNVNRASEQDLKAVLGLTDAEASALVTARSGETTFRTIDDLKKIRGLDARKLDEHKDAIGFSDR